MTLGAEFLVVLPPYSTSTLVGPHLRLSPRLLPNALDAAFVVVFMVRSEIFSIVLT